MNPPPPELPARSFAVTFESGSSYNRDFAGKGTVTFRGAECVVRGRRRRFIGTGPEMELVIRLDQIWNVAHGGRGVEFVTSVGRSAAKKAPFLFFCANAEEAAEVAALLPATTTADQRELQVFRRRLLAVSAGERGRVSVTELLVGACLVVYIIMGLFGAGWIEPASMKPYVLFAANNAAATTAGEWWRLVTAMFVHYGLLHLFVNVWALYQLGGLVERLFGRALFTMVYFASGIAGSLTTLLWHGDRVWSAGASGAIFGLCGALLGFLWREKHGVPGIVLKPLLKTGLTFAGYNLVFGAVYAKADNACHVGGLVGGFIFGAICALPLDRDARRRGTPGRLVASLGLLAAAVGVTVAAAPRYNYRVEENWRFEEAASRHTDQEKKLLQAGDKAFADAKANRKSAGLEAWLSQQAIPLYDQWNRELDALPLTSGTSTARRRDALARIFRLDAENYRLLLDALRRNDADGVRRYNAQEKAIEAEAEAYRKMK